MVPGDLHPSPLFSDSSQRPILLNVAGAVSEFKCTSGIFISFWDHHEKSFQWFRFCEKKSAVVLFFLEAAEKAHLQSIREKWRGQGVGTLHPGWTGPWMEMGGTGARVAVGFGWAPSPLEMKGCLSQGSLRPLRRSGQAAQGWADRACGCCVWHWSPGD